MNITTIIDNISVELCGCSALHCRAKRAALATLRELREHLPALVNGEHQNCHRNRLTVPDVQCCAFCRARAVLAKFNGKEVPPCPTH